MKDIIEQAKDTTSSCCPDLDLKTRVIGFLITFIIGFLILLGSLGSLFSILTGGTTWFAICYTAGNFICLSSSFFLVGPQRQCKNMLDPVRATVSIVFIASMAMTLVSAFIFKSTVITLICVAIQFCSLIWYVLSYIPYGRQFCTKCLKSCCCGEADEEKKEPII